jgi:molybdenum cofactor guanylyltransferase
MALFVLELVMPSRQVSLAGIVLAGGESQRMGRNKALMELHGQPLIARVLDKLGSLCDELIIAASDPASYASLGVQAVPDVLLNRGPLSGIHAGLAAMHAERAVVVGCDMPFLNAALLRYLASLGCDWDAVVPQIGGQFEPLHAVYGVACVKAIEELVVAGPRRIVHLYQRVRTHVVTEETVRSFDPHLYSFVNVNTPQEWEQIQRIVI